MTSEPLTILLRHYRWLTGVLLDRCASLTPEQFHQRFEIGSGSLHDTINHIIGCVERWVARVKGEKREGLDGKNSVGQLRDRLDKSAAAVIELVSELQMADMMDHQRTMTVLSSEGRNVDVTFTAGAAVTHCLVHASYHASQAVNMLRRLGVSPLPELDVLDWQIETENKR